MFPFRPISVSPRVQPWRLAALALLACMPHVARAADPLPALRAQLDDTSVSGLSSGAFMAVQFAVAHARIVRGAGIVAGGPYYCARGKVLTATTVCSCTSVPLLFVCQVAPGATRVDELAKIAAANASRGVIDPLSQLARQRVWMFSGRADSIVPQAVMNDLYAWYARFVPASAIRYRKDVEAEHAMPTDGYGNDCGRLGDPYLSNCGVDGAGELLQWIHGPLAPRNDGAARGRLAVFDQREFVDGRPLREHGLAESGWVYVPHACEASSGARCRVHVAFHGCRQNAAAVGDRFARHAGYNRWADTNRFIVLYPQTQATPNNPKACWNWFDAERNDPGYATRDGVQMQAVRRMVERLAGIAQGGAPGQTAQCFTSSNFEHVRSGRAHLDFFLWARANGSNDSLGFADAFSTSTLKKTGPNHYVAGRCP